MADVNNAGKRKPRGPYVGQKGNGRPKGAVSKTTKDVKEALELAFQGAGGVQKLTEWAVANPDGFYPVWSKLLPKNLDLTSGGQPIALTEAERIARIELLIAKRDAHR